MPESAAIRLVVVDDEPGILSLVSDYLAKDGYAVAKCRCGAELDRQLESGWPDLVILDVSLPGEDGFSIARRLRAARPTPIIMLTGLHDIVDRIVGLEVGADDYLTKPFDLRELKARVRAVLRRAAPAADLAAEKSGSTQRKHLSCFGQAYFDFEGRCLLDSEGAQLPLTATEFDLLAVFAKHPNRVLTREHLLEAIPGRASESCDRTIDIRVTRIRRRIEVDPAKPQVIRTVRSVGYVYVPSQNHAPPQARAGGG
jgi:DNA-binding response OmpR family regulator